MAKNNPPAPAKPAAGSQAPAAAAGDNRTVAVFNRGQRTYRTSAGLLLPGASMPLPEREAKSMLGYHDLVDASKMTRGATAAADPAQQKQVDDLKTENAKLKEEAAAFEKVKADLEDQVLKLQGDVERLEKAAAKK